MLRPARLIRRAQRVRIIVSVARIGAVGARQQAQPADPATRTETRREWIHPTIARSRRIHAAALIRAQENARPIALRERHQRVPTFAIEQHEAARFTNQIDLTRRQPSHEL